MVEITNKISIEIIDWMINEISNNKYKKAYKLLTLAIKYNKINSTRKGSLEYYYIYDLKNNKLHRVNTFLYDGYKSIIYNEVKLK